MNERQKNLIKDISKKAEPVSGHEVKTLAKEFRDKLNRLNKTQTKWCAENGIKDSLLSNTLAGAITSRPTLSLVAKYVLDDNWQ